VVGSLTINEYAREGCVYTKGFSLNFQYHMRGSGIRTDRSMVRNNTRNEGVANVAGHALTKSSCKQCQLATRPVREILTTPKEDQEHLLSCPSVQSSLPTETVFKEYRTAL